MKPHESDMTREADALWAYWERAFGRGVLDELLAYVEGRLEQLRHWPLNSVDVNDLNTRWNTPPSAAGELRAVAERIREMKEE